MKRKCVICNKRTENWQRHAVGLGIAIGGCYSTSDMIAERLTDGRFVEDNGPIAGNG